MSRLVERVRAVDQARWDALLVALVTALILRELIALGERVDGPMWANLLAGLVMGGGLWWRRSRPLLSVIVVMAMGALMALLLTSPPKAGASILPLLIVAYSAGAHARGRNAAIGLSITAGTVLTIVADRHPRRRHLPLLHVRRRAVACRTRDQRPHRARPRAGRERGSPRSPARVRRSSTPSAMERSRVARELHDVLAHNLSVMVIQASGARRALDADPQAAIDAAALIERTGREALVELRHVFGAVRHGEGESLEGSPGLAQVEALVERAQRAGLPVTLSVEGDPVELGPGADMAAYRLIQEALTNTLKHAGAATTKVTIRHRPDGVAIEVSDDGDAPAPMTARLDSGGQGLVGMRERISLYGGELEVGPRERGRVRGARPPAARASGGGRMSVRVLLVDDQALIRAGFRMILDAEPDIEVVGESANGAQAVDSAKRLKPHVVADGHPHARDGRDRGDAADRLAGRQTAPIPSAC